MVKFFFRTLINSAAIYIADILIEGFTFSGDFVILVGIGLVLALSQTLIYPIIRIVALPFALLGFGFLGAIVNAVILWIIALYIPELTIVGVVPLVLTTVVLGTANILFSWL